MSAPREQVDMTMTDIRALCFDVFGTVVDWRNSIATEVDVILGEQGLNVDAQAFALAWRACYQPSMEKVRSGNRGFVKLDDLHRENLLTVLKSFDVRGLGDDVIDHLNFAWHRLNPWPDAVSGLKRLKKNIFWHRFQTVM